MRAADSNCRDQPPVPRDGGVVNCSPERVILSRPEQVAEFTGMHTLSS